MPNKIAIERGSRKWGQTPVQRSGLPTRDRESDSRGCRRVRAGCGEGRPGGLWECPAYRGSLYPMAAKNPLGLLRAFGLPSGLACFIVEAQSPPKTAVSRVPRGQGPGAFSFCPPR